MHISVNFLYQKDATSVYVLNGLRLEVFGQQAKRNMENSS